MVKYKCFKIQCPVCGRTGSCQTFLNKQNKITYARTRHYLRLDPTTKKPQFEYHKIRNLEALKTLLNITYSTGKADNGQGGQGYIAIAFGYLIYTFYDTILYNPIAMNQKHRILLRYLSTKITDWDELEAHKKKMLMEMIHTSGDYTKGVDKFYEIVRGWWSHFNARIVCALFVPALSGLTFIFFLIGDYYLVNSIEIFTFSRQYTALYALIIPVMIGISLCLGIGSLKPLKEATYYEYLFIKNKIQGNEEHKKDENTFQKMITILQDEKWDKNSEAKKP